MDFEKCPTCDPDNWQPIEHDQLQRELTPAEIDLMLEQKATVRKGMAKYRRFVPAVVRDWAKP